MASSHESEVSSNITQVSHGTLGADVSINEAQIASASRDAITYFLNNCKLDIPTVQRDVPLEARVKEIISSWGLEDMMRPYCSIGILVASMAFAHIPDLDNRVQIALYTTLNATLDVADILDHVPFQDFHWGCCVGILQDDPGIFGRLLENLRGMWKFYVPFGANGIFASTLQFLNGTILEKMAQDTVLSKDARLFVEYRRALVGIPEAFAMFIWDKARFPDITVYMQALPDVMLYINYLNDIFSFYKEALAGETRNYIQGRVVVSGKSPAEILLDVIDETLGAMERVRRILGDGEARDAWESFARGFLAVHVSSPRYRLAEIIDCKYVTD